MTIKTSHFTDFVQTSQMRFTQVTLDSHAVRRGFNQSQVVSFRKPSVTLMFLDSKNSWALARFNQIDLRMKFHHEFQQIFVRNVLEFSCRIRGFFVGFHFTSKLISMHSGQISSPLGNSPHKVVYSWGNPPKIAWRFRWEGKYGNFAQIHPERVTTRILFYIFSRGSL